MDGSSSHASAAGDLDTQVLPGETYASHALSTTVPHTLPPHEDDRPSLARQKRKRTCAADQDALEAAYARDPKPDKTARLEIVRHVSLGEKEVQIWFQNRRQSSRRKSRPLLPHEIAQYQLARSEQSPQMYNGSPAPGNAPSFDTEEKTEAPGWAQSAPDIPQMLTMPSSESRPARTNLEQYEVMRPAAGQLPMALPTDPELESRGRLALQPHMAFEFSATQAVDANHRHVGYLANRRSAPQLWMNQTEQDPRFVPAPVAAEPGRRLKKASSCVRLSMSFDGNATIVTKDGSSPSPPRASQTLMPLLNDAAIPSPNLRATEQASDGAAQSSLRRVPSGRSRDSRAWEFWCDKDARVELEDKAEKDSNGSAADAIGLLRSASGRSILGPLPRKRNSLLSRHPSDVKRVKLDRQRPTLQRSNTSLGRLQAESSGFNSAIGDARASLKHSESALSVFVPGNDSDKENWSPIRKKAIGSSHAHPASQPQSTKSALREDRNKGNGVLQRPGGRSNRKRVGDSGLDGENADPEADVEIAAFMDGARKSSSTSVEDELDCVQGLLSLSQGNWR